VNYPGNNNQPVHPTCLCATGTTNCSGTCKTTGTYTTNDGDCTGTCNTAYVQQRNQCGNVTNAKYSTYTTTACGDGCGPPAITCAECLTKKTSTYPYAMLDGYGHYCVVITKRCDTNIVASWLVYKKENGNWILYKNAENEICVGGTGGCGSSGAAPPALCQTCN
jgi:hypothetical protein